MVSSAEVVDDGSRAPVLQGSELSQAQRVFGSRLPLAQRYVEHLATSGIDRGLMGPREVPRLWERHVLNCAVVSELIPHGSLVADVGSGAGLPGLCLALAREDLHLILIEPLERRVLWLEEVILDLGLEQQVEVIRARAENVVELVDADVVTARAVSALDKLLKVTVPLLHGSGELLAIKGRSAESEVAAASKTLTKLKAKSAAVLTVGKDLTEPTTVVRVQLSS